MKTLSCLIGISLLFLAGCGPKEYGYAQWQQYQEPPAIQFTESEKALVDVMAGVDSKEANDLLGGLTVEQALVLNKFAVDGRSAMKKIMLQKNAWRAIVQAHNKEAKELVAKQLKALGIETAEDVKLKEVKKF